MFEANDPNSIQLTADGQLRHFPDHGRAAKELLTEILDTADSFVDKSQQQVKSYRCCAARL